MEYAKIARRKMGRRRRRNRNNNTNRAAFADGDAISYKPWRSERIKNEFNKQEIDNYDLDLTSLKSILGLRRPSCGYGQSVLANALQTITCGTIDSVGNVWAHISSDNKWPKTMFTSHIDTVHKDEGISTIINIGGYMNTNGILGADDGAGVYIMLKMFLSGVPGLYVWFADEEIGRVGSEYWLASNEHLCVDIDLCVSFDRAGSNEVIHNQLGINTASVDAAQWVSDAIGNGYSPSAFGCYTDSFSFRKKIPECMNIGVGYECAHTQNEFVDASHVDWLAEKCCKTDWSACPVIRNNKTCLDFSDEFGSVFDDSHIYDRFNDSPGLTDYSGCNAKSYGRQLQYGDFEDDRGNPDSFEDSQLVSMISDDPQTALSILKKHYETSQLIGMFLT
jgi:hypothetical protein